MRSALAPVEAGSANRAIRRLQSRNVDAEFRKPAFASAGDRDGTVIERNQFEPCQPSEELNGAFASQMIVTDPRPPHFGISWTRTYLKSARVLSETHQRFYCCRHIGPSQPIVAVASLLLDSQQASVQQLRQVAARSRRSDTGDPCQLARSQCLPSHQGCQHVRTRGVAH